MSIFLLLPRGFSQEDITITTYYPSPEGVYKDLRSGKLAIGDNYIDNSQYCWEGICTNPIDADADLIVEGNVGVGTENPQSSQDGRTIELDVAENIIAKDVYLKDPKSGNPRWASECTGSYPNCSWNSTTVWHTAGGIWDEVICPDGCVVRGIRTTEDPAFWEQHQIYCCCP